jgi:hypothetical protein
MLAWSGAGSSQVGPVGLDGVADSNFSRSAVDRAELGHLVQDPREGESELAHTEIPHGHGASGFGFVLRQIRNRNRDTKHTSTSNLQQHTPAFLLC